jgi:2,4-dienoyl-CoA reductase-like NADH-dependent reductase (Old Yellow Enzyme family)
MHRSAKRLKSRLSKLFEPLQLRDVRLRNRVVVSPMCMYSSEDGFANDWHLVHLGSRAVGGAGLVFTEAAAVEPRGRITPDDLGIWKDEHVEMLARIARFVAQSGAAAGVQLAHAGRKGAVGPPWARGVIPESGGGWTPLAPSAMAFDQDYAEPHALSVPEIGGIVQAFRDAATRALGAGFRVLEIHAAHGYLLHEFLSPDTNLRDDAYGGSFDQRIRIVLEVVDAVRTVWPEKLPLFVRVSAIDWSESGWQIEDTVALARLLKARGVDVIDCSSGGLSPAAPRKFGPRYQVPFARQVKLEADIATCAVGLITTAAEAEAILEEGSADLIALAREHLRDPYFAYHAAAELASTNEGWPQQYSRA